MPSKYRLRYLFKNRFLIRNLAKFLHRLHIKPNHASILMLLFSVIATFLLLVQESLVLFGIFVLITTIFDGVDGAIARMYNQETKFGGFLDSTLDRISECIIFGGLFFGGGKFFIFGSSQIFHSILLIIGLISSLMISYMRSRAALEIDEDFDVGLFARSERLFSIFLITIIPFNELYSIGLIILTIGIISTAFFRFLKYRAYFGKKANQT